MILRPVELTLPLNVDSVYDRDAPLVLEVGFGDGKYLAHLGKTHPDWNLLGVEVSMGAMWRAYRRMKREHIHHVRLFHGDARFVVRDAISPGSVHRIYVNFPDPWPRKKHWGNRLLSSGFFELASTRLEDGGSVALTTDHADYFDFALNQAEQSNLFRAEPGPAPESTLHTKYALKWQEQERPIYHSMFIKTGEAAPVAGRVQLADMQHALLSGDLGSVEGFEKIAHRFDGGQVVVLEAFRELSGTGLLFKVLVEESELRQEVVIQAWEKSDGIYVGLQQFGDPLGTKGIKEGITVIVNWLVDQGMTVVKTWI